MLVHRLNQLLKSHGLWEKLPKAAFLPQRGTSFSWFMDKRGIPLTQEALEDLLTRPKSALLQEGIQDVQKLKEAYIRYWLMQLRAGYSTPELEAWVLKHLKEQPIKQVSKPLKQWLRQARELLTFAELPSTTKTPVFYRFPYQDQMHWRGQPLLSWWRVWRRVQQTPKPLRWLVRGYYRLKGYHPLSDYTAIMPHLSDSPTVYEVPMQIEHIQRTWDKQYWQPYDKDCRRWLKTLNPRDYRHYIPTAEKLLSEAEAHLQAALPAYYTVLQQACVNYAAYQSAAEQARKTLVADCQAHLSTIQPTVSHVDMTAFKASLFKQIEQRVQIFCQRLEHEALAVKKKATLEEKTQAFNQRNQLFWLQRITTLIKECAVEIEAFDGSEYAFKRLVQQFEHLKLSLAELAQVNRWASNKLYHTELVPWAKGFKRHNNLFLEAWQQLQSALKNQEDKLNIKLLNQIKAPLKIPFEQAVATVQTQAYSLLGLAEELKLINPQLDIDIACNELQDFADNRLPQLLKSVVKWQDYYTAIQASMQDLNTLFAELKTMTQTPEATKTMYQQSLQTIEALAQDTQALCSEAFLYRHQWLAAFIRLLNAKNNPSERDVLSSNTAELLESFKTAIEDYKKCTEKTYNAAIEHFYRRQANFAQSAQKARQSLNTKRSQWLVRLKQLQSDTLSVKEHRAQLDALRNEILSELARYEDTTQTELNIMRRYTPGFFKQISALKTSLMQQVNAANREQTAVRPAISMAVVPVPTHSVSYKLWQQMQGRGLAQNDIELMVKQLHAFIQYLRCPEPWAVLMPCLTYLAHHISAKEELHPDQAEAIAIEFLQVRYPELPHAAFVNETQLTSAQFYEFEVMRFLLANLGLVQGLSDIRKDMSWLREKLKKEEQHMSQELEKAKQEQQAIRQNIQELEKLVANLLEEKLEKERLAEPQAAFSPRV